MFMASSLLKLPRSPYLGRFRNASAIRPAGRNSAETAMTVPVSFSPLESIITLFNLPIVPFEFERSAMQPLLSVSSGIVERRDLPKTAIRSYITKISVLIIISKKKKFIQFHY